MALGDDGILYAVAITFGEGPWGAYAVDALTGEATLIKPIDYDGLGDVVVSDNTMYLTSGADELVVIDLQDAGGGTSSAPPWKMPWV